MSAAVNKLKSNSGATLLMALLFFAICAVTGSMILLSATAAAGRLSVMKETDQNYYAVRSATKMVEQMLTSEYIEAKEVLTIVETTTHSSGGGEGEGGGEPEDDEDEVTTTYTYEGPKFYLVTVTNNHGTITESVSSTPIDSDNGIMMKLLKDTNVGNYSGKLSANVTNADDRPSMFDEKWFLSTAGSSSSEVHSSVTVKASTVDPLTDKEFEELAVDMTATMDGNGLLNIDFENHGSLDNKYKMSLKMQCSRSRELEEKEESSHSEDEDVVTTVKTRIYKFKLTPVSIEKG